MINYYVYWKDAYTKTLSNRVKIVLLQKKINQINKKTKKYKFNQIFKKIHIIYYMMWYLKYQKQNWKKMKLPKI